MQPPEGTRRKGELGGGNLTTARAHLEMMLRHLIEALDLTAEFGEHLLGCLTLRRHLCLL
jgi:hypothetical protein